MRNVITISNRCLSVEVLLPDDTGCRFDSACNIRQVILNGIHTFCRPEQLRPERRSSGGWGLCSEFLWDEVALAAEPGTRFPKPGIGLLTQVPEGGPFDKWNPYHIDYFKKTWERRPDGMTFREIPEPCNGYAVFIQKDLTLFDNTITIATTVHNVGEKAIDLLEYQHNFVAIDALPAGPGHRLEVPCDSQLSQLEQSFHSRLEPDRSKQIRPAAHVQGYTAHWEEDMEMKTFFKTTPGDALIPNLPFTWRLSHDQSDASITEVSHFVPEKMVLWGNEHCICPEVFARICLAPGQEKAFSRTWLFEDGTTKKM